jgi:putative transposase
VRIDGRAACRRDVAPIVIYSYGVRYADGGGLDVRGRARREQVRMQAAQLFEQQVPAEQVAKRLRVSAKSAYAWQRTWRELGRDGLASKGPSGSACRLDDARLRRLADALDEGPAAHGWVEDQRWTLPRITALIGRLFHVRYTERGVSYLLHRMGWSPQVPVHRAAERDETAIASWRTETWSRVRRSPGN